MTPKPAYTLIVCPNWTVWLNEGPCLSSGQGIVIGNGDDARDALLAARVELTAHVIDIEQRLEALRKAGAA